MTGLPLNTDKLTEISVWLEQNMANPPLPESQRWDLVEYSNGLISQWRLHFKDAHDATLYALRWS